jgi:hypothetical protein
MSDLVEREIDQQSLALEVARNHVGMKLPVEELLQRLGVPQDYFLGIANDPVFRRLVRDFTKELEENGVSFQLKARIQAEEMLKRQWRLVHDPDTPAAVTVKAIENTVRWAGLEPKNAVQQVTPGAGFSVTINLPPLPPLPTSQVVDGTAERLT